MNPELPAEKEMKKSPCPSWPAPQASRELSCGRLPQKSAKKCFLILLREPPTLTAGGPLAGQLWVLVPGAESHRVSVLSSSRKWFQTPRQNRTEKDLTRDIASSAKQPKAVEGDAGLPRSWLQMATDGQLWGSPGKEPKAALRSLSHRVLV